MGRISETFRKQGGWSLIWGYIHARVMHNAIIQVMATGLSRISLEMVRLTAQLKTYQHLHKKYLPLLQEFDSQYQQKSAISDSSKKVWFCWMQGIKNAPMLVRTCYASLQQHLQDRELILITSDNINDYVSFPEHITRKYKNGKITHTHFSDILRVALLAKYGGTWIDATVFCSGGRIPQYMLESDFFVFQNLKPGADGHILNISSWFMTAQAGNRIVLAVKYLLEAYWNKNDRLIDYFLVHHFFAMVKEYYAEEWKQIPQYPNSMPHILLLNMFEPYDKEKWEELKMVCPFHKLTYKSSKENLEKEGTYYKRIVES